MSKKPNPTAPSITDEVLDELDRRLERAIKTQAFSAVEDVWGRNLRRVLAALRRQEGAGRAVPEDHDGD